MVGEDAGAPWEQNAAPTDSVPRSRPPVRDPAVSVEPQIWIAGNSRVPNLEGFC